MSTGMIQRVNAQLRSLGSPYVAKMIHSDDPDQTDDEITFELMGVASSYAIQVCAFGGETTFALQRSLYTNGELTAVEYHGEFKTLMRAIKVIARLLNETKVGA